MCRHSKGKEAEQNWFVYADPRRAEPQLKKSQGQKWNKALPEKSMLSDEINWNANVFCFFFTKQCNRQKYSKRVIWPLTPSLRKKLYFPLRSSLNIRYIKTETLTCVEHIYSNVMFWYSLATSGFSDVPNQKCFLSVSLLKFRSQQNFTNRKVIKVWGLSCGCLHRQRVQSRISVFWSLLLQFYLKFHQAGLNFQ